jgi:hypothetical protein
VAAQLVASRVLLISTEVVSYIDTVTVSICTTGGTMARENKLLLLLYTRDQVWKQKSFNGSSYCRSITYTKNIKHNLSKGNIIKRHAAA